MEKCIDSLLPGGDDVEIIIVNDGSTDKTASIANEYAVRFPHIVKVIHQNNRGHGGAINTGIKHATGKYFKVVDSDDWVDATAYRMLMKQMRHQINAGIYIDMFISNFVYDKLGISKKTKMHYENILPENRLFTWNEVRRFPKRKYILMHSVIFNAEVLKKSKICLPENTFYVDNLFVYLPLPYVRTMYYMNIDFYRYFIGREGQSVNEEVMIRRIDQQIKINKLMFELFDIRKIENKRLNQYMFNYLVIITTVTSVLLTRSGTEENLKKRKNLWIYIKNKDFILYIKLRFCLFGIVANLPGRVGRLVTLAIYEISRQIYGFN
jgi:glycosyltransferase involved in cell wall biosynthesis